MGKKYFVRLENSILGYVDGYAWVPMAHPTHHRMASEWFWEGPPKGAEFQQALGKWVEEIFGALDKSVATKLTVVDAENYFRQEEDKLSAPWSIAEGMIDAGAKRILLYGPPGVGKSFTPWKYAQKVGAEFFSVTLTDMTPMAELRGHFVIRGMDTVWHDGILSRAWRASHKAAKDAPQPRVIMVLNEIDHVGADAESFLHNFLDDPEMARIYLPTGEMLVPGNIQVVATMNGEPEDLADALRDRFTVKVELTDPHPEALGSLPKELQDFARRMIVNPPKGQERMSLRGFFDFVRLVEGAEKKPGAIAQAARAIFGDRGDDVVQALRIARAG